MNSIFFNPLIERTIQDLQQAPIQENKLKYFLRSEIIARVVGLFASLVAVFECIAQICQGNGKNAFFFLKLVMLGSIIGVISPSLIKKISFSEQSATRSQPQPLMSSSVALPEIPVPSLHLILRNKDNVSIQDQLNAIDQVLSERPEAINELDQNQRTPLYRAIFNNQPNRLIILKLLEKGGIVEGEKNDEEKILKEVLRKNTNPIPVLFSFLIFYDSKKLISFLEGILKEESSTWDKRLLVQSFISYQKTSETWYEHLKETLQEWPTDLVGLVNDYVFGEQDLIKEMNLETQLKILQGEKLP